MLSQLEQACKAYSTESSSGVIEFDSNWQRIFVTALTFLLDQTIPEPYEFCRLMVTDEKQRKTELIGNQMFPQMSD